jgi:hypothetical protein
MGQMILSEPSFIIVRTYQDMMEWMSRMLVGEMAGANDNEILARELENIVADLSSNCNPTWTQHDQHGPDDPFRTINHHCQDISGHDGMDEQDVGWRNGWCR